VKAQPVLSLSKETVKGVEVIRGPGEQALRDAVRTFRPDPGDPPQKMALWHALRDRTNAEDLRNLCFMLGFDYDMLPGDSRTGKARELVTHFDRREDLETLAAALHQLRPDIET